MMQNNDSMKQAYLWNTASGMVNAGQSAVILIFISHFLTRNDAGIFTIGYALANLVMTMGKYGMRNYQVTDIREHFTFRTYRKSRLLTTAMALAFTAVYLLVNAMQGAYSTEKILVVLLICLWKLIDSVEDVYYGMYQQRGRLDIAGKCYTFRLLISMAVLCALIALRVPLVTACLVTVIVSAVAAVLFIQASVRRFNTRRRRKESGSGTLPELLKVCFPLFISMSLSIYLGNAPKYMIDWYLDDATQAVFSYIMMPAFVISVLNQFIYQPIVRGLAELWQSGDREQFRRRVFRQYLIIGGLTALVIAGGALLGIPVLSLLYNTDLKPFKQEFLVLLLGGGVFALVSFIMVPLTAMRLQHTISYGMIAVSVVSLLAGKLFVTRQGVMGAALLYLALNTLLAVYLTLCFSFGVRSSAPPVDR